MPFVGPMRQWERDGMHSRHTRVRNTQTKCLIRFLFDSFSSCSFLFVHFSCCTMFQHLWGARSLSLSIHPFVKSIGRDGHLLSSLFTRCLHWSTRLVCFLLRSWCSLQKSQIIIQRTTCESMRIVYGLLLADWMLKDDEIRYTMRCELLSREKERGIEYNVHGIMIFFSFSYQVVDGVCIECAQ